MEELKLEEVFKRLSGREEDKGFLLEDINLCIEKGSFVSLLGESGCGKTTLLRLICGFLTPDNGRILFSGKDITMVPPEKRGFALVAQNPLLFPNMNILKNVEFGLKMQGVAKSKRKAMAEEMLEKVGLCGFAERYANQLSGGQGQRAAIARALVVKPRLLLMDEPFSALNEELRADMMKLLKEVHKTTGTTVLFVTHNKEEAAVLSDKIVVMRNGRVVEVRGNK